MASGRCSYATCRRESVALVDGWLFCGPHELEHRAMVREEEQRAVVDEAGRFLSRLDRWAARRDAALRDLAAGLLVAG